MLVSGRASATEVELQAETALQGYQITDPWGDVIVERRRFTQTVALGLYNLQGRYKPGEADYRAVFMMRLDSDFGVNARLSGAQAGGETTYATPGGNGLRFVPGLQQHPVDLVYGYVEGRNIAHGLLGFRLGRQYVTDVLGWWSFDGGLVRVTTPFFLQIEAYGGLEQRGGMPLSTSRYEQQGVWRGSHTGFGTAVGQPSVVDYPSYIYTQPAPAFGFAVESVGPSWIHSRFSYRRVYNTGTALTTQFPEANGGGYHAIDGIRIAQERLGFSADVGKPDLGTMRGGFTYDLYNQIFASFFGSVEAQLGKRATIGADIDYFVPTFDADSIWNWFTHGPITTITGRAAVRFTKRFDLSASGGARLWWAEGDASTDATTGLSKFGAGQCGAAQAQLSKVGAVLDCALGQVYLDPGYNAVSQWTRDSANRAATTTVDAIGNLNGRYRFGLADISLRGMFEVGSRGTREGADLAGEARLDGGRFTVGSRVSLYGWSDPTRPDRDAVSFGYVLAAGFRPAQFARFRLEWEHDTNRLVGQRYRLVGLVNLLVVK
ncbi:Hypothetical protein A7982_03454 [Minicystis rosea]|nr:Hypothetical protein A7982_03454 [Minicystis rosea]